MRSRNFRTCFALLALASATTFAQAPDCDRMCLRTVLDEYLSAIVANDPAAAPLFVGFRQTENAVVVKKGAGLWASARRLGELERRLLDPVTGQAAYFGTVEEDGGAAIVLVRVRIVDREVSEAEWYIARPGDPGINGPVAPGERGNLYDLQNLLANPPPERSVARAERASRAALLAITNSYFDGITTRDGSIIMAHPGCLRVENGLQTTGRPVENPGPGETARTDCTSNLETIDIPLVAARRYPLVDEQAQVVLGMVVFLRAPGSARRRNGLSELFYIDDDRIRSIYAAMFYPSPDAPMPNWPPYDGNFPLPASLLENP
jgi:hypothetical protein